MQRITPPPKIHPGAKCILTHAMSKLYWLVLSRKQNNISAASPFHFAFFPITIPPDCMEAAWQVLLSPYQTWNRGRQSPGFFPHASASPGLLPEQHQTQAYHQILKLQRFSQLTESVET